MGWKSLKNGELLTAAAAEFDIFVTIDGNIPTSSRSNDSTSPCLC